MYEKVVNAKTKRVLESLDKIETIKNDLGDFKMFQKYIKKVLK